MVVLRGRPVGNSGAGEGSCAGSGAGQLDDQMREFISCEIMRSILEQTLVIFGSVKEGILEILDEWLSTFHAEIVALVRKRSLTFMEFRACGAPDYHEARDPITSNRWLADVANAFRTSCCPLGGQG